MLVLTRKLKESIQIGDDVTITFLELRNDGSVRLGIDAPSDVRIHRTEVIQAIAASNAESAADTGNTAHDIIAALGTRTT